MMLIGIASHKAAAFQYEINHEFQRPGKQPLGPLIEHTDGNYYGTTTAGGVFDLGTVYRLSPTGNIEYLHSFAGPDGAAPTSRLAEASNGDLYGSTSQGGINGFGILFKISIQGDFQKLVDFTGSSGAFQGSVPQGLARHTNGDFYGVTQAGGSSNNGTLFRLSPNGVFSHEFSFTGTTGLNPGAEPVRGLSSSGNLLYGVTRAGGANNLGTVFSFNENGQHQILVNFSGDSGSHPGERPACIPFLDTSGLLYGTTEYGGDNNVGVLFSINTQASNAYSVLHHFSDATGSQPSGSLAIDSSGNLRGTTSNGGLDGLGAIYQLSPDNQYMDLIHFSDESDPTPGAAPQGGLTLTSDDSFIGAASAGGPGQRGALFKMVADSYQLISNLSAFEGWTPSGAPIADAQGNLYFPLAEGGEFGLGTIAKIDANGTVSTSASFNEATGGGPSGPLAKRGSDFVAVTVLGNGSGKGAAVLFQPNGTLAPLAGFTSTSGENVNGPLTADGNGSLFGAAEAGGLANRGVLFSIDKSNTLSRLFSFTGATVPRLGSVPQNPVVAHPNGSLYGLTLSGGVNDQGTLYQVNPDNSLISIASFNDNGPRQPQGGLTLAADGKLYGSTSLGGDSDNGTIIQLDPQSNQWSEVDAFTGTNGANPRGPLILGTDGYLYGITTSGADGFGSAFRIFPGQSIETLVTFTEENGGRPTSGPYEWRTGTFATGGLNASINGKIYGVSPSGGSKGGGVVFSISLDLPYESWKLSNLGDSSAPDSGDPDQDGLVNLVEYALGGNPIAPDREDQLAFDFVKTNTGTAAQLSFKRDPAKADITLIVEANDNLTGPWIEIARSESGSPLVGTATVVGDSDDIDSVNVAVQYPLNQNVTSSCFLRIRVTN